jgi:hypothetical protein
MIALPRRAVAGLLVAAAVLAVGAGPAAGADAPAWSSPALVDHAPPFATSHDTMAISCPSETLCVAVDAAGNAVTSHDPAAATPTWSLPGVVDPNGAFLTAVSCPSTSLCVAVGDLGTVMISRNPAADAPTWSAPVTIDPVPDATPPNGLNSLSCPSTSLCVAVNNVGDAIVSTNPAADTPVWTRTPAHIAAHGLNSVSCASTALCVAVDNQGGLVITTNPTAATPTWKPYVDVDVDAAGHVLNGISCPSTTLCVAVDDAGNVLTSTNPTAVTPSWSVTQASTDALRAVSCPSSALCVAVGNVGNLVVSTAPAASAWVQKGGIGAGNHLVALACPTAALCIALPQFGGTATWSTTPGGSSTSWTALRQIDGINSFSAVACPAETLCVAVDNAGHMARTRNPAAVAPAWELTSQQGSFTDISCPSTELCVAGRSNRPPLVSTDPGAATPTWVPEFPSAGFLLRVSCPTTTFCLAVNSQGQFTVTTTPGQPHDPDDLTPQWSDAAALPDPDSNPGPPVAISCPTASLCAVAGRSGNVWITTSAGAAAPTWSVTADPTGFAVLSDISCPTAERCIATDLLARAYVSTNPAAATPAWSVSQDPVGTLVDCRTASFCITTRGPYTAFSTDPFASSPSWTPQLTGLLTSLLTGVSCASPDVCAAIDDSGRTLLRIAAPANTVPPALSGTAAVGQTLTAVEGTWTATPAVTRQWERCDAAGGACGALPAQTGPSYAVTASDVGGTLRVRETAENGGGSAAAASSTSAVVPALAVTPVTTTPPLTTVTTVTPHAVDIKALLRRALAPKGKAARLRTLVKRGGFISSFAAPSAGRLVLRWYSRPKHRRAKAMLLASGSTRITKRRTVKPKVKLTRAGKRLLRASRRITVTGRGFFTPTRKATVRATRTLKLKR